MSFLCWFLATVSVAAFVHFEYRAIAVLPIVFMAVSLVFSWRAIREMWFEKQTWWQENNAISFLMIGQCVYLAVALLLFLDVVIEWDKIPHSHFVTSLIGGITFVGWFLGERARANAIKARWKS